MVNSTVESVDHKYGFTLLLQHGKGMASKHLDHYTKYCQELRDHPFGLDLPVPNPIFGREIRYVGAGATDISVDVFLANIRFWTNCHENALVEKLRVINSPDPRHTKKENQRVSFEVWIGTLVIISGETNNFSGAGNAARRQLENVFATLSMIYAVPIERVSLKQAVSLDQLHGWPAVGSRV